MLKEQYKLLLTKIITGYLPDCSIYLFGSRAKGRSSSGSDIDLALDNNSKIELKILNDIRNDIEESMVPFFVDLVDLNNVDDLFSGDISKDLVVWKK